MTCILVVGLMRSGTSLISKQLHELGVPMGSELRFSFPGPGGQLDYEDIIFTDKCLATIKGEADIGDLHSFFQNYARDRREQGYTIWGVKSPFVLPYVDLFKRMVGEPVKVIRTIRNVEATYKSLERQVGTMEKQLDVNGILSQMTRVQDMLRTCTVDADLTIDITESWTSPESVRDKLIELING